MSRFLTLATIAALLAPTVMPTAADAAKRVCGERSKMTKFLTEKYTEQPRAVGVAGTGKALVEIYTSATGTWTFLLTTAKGKSCIIGAGHSWEESDKLALLPKT